MEGRLRIFHQLKLFNRISPLAISKGSAFIRSLRFGSTTIRLVCGMVLVGVLTDWFGERVSAGLVIPTVGTNHVIDFESTVLNVNNGEFAGNGLASNPAVGQLDADSWTITGFSSSSDLARGRSSGGVTTGGLYAFVTNSGASDENVILGVQPTGSDFTPGAITLEISNQTGQQVHDWSLGYDVFALNNGNRSSIVEFAYSTDGLVYHHLSPLDYQTPQSGDSTPIWQSESRSTGINAIVNDGESLFVRWTSDDFSGSGSRDEYGIDNLFVRANGGASVPEPSSVALFTVLTITALLGRTRFRRLVTKKEQHQAAGRQ